MERVFVKINVHHEEEINFVSFLKYTYIGGSDGYIQSYDTKHLTTLWEVKCFTFEVVLKWLNIVLLELRLNKEDGYQFIGL